MSAEGLVSLQVNVHIDEDSRAKAIDLSEPDDPLVTVDISDNGPMTVVLFFRDPCEVDVLLDAVTNARALIQAAKEKA